MIVLIMFLLIGVYGFLILILMFKGVYIFYRGKKNYNKWYFNILKFEIYWVKFKCMKWCLIYIYMLKVKVIII